MLKKTIFFIIIFIVSLVIIFTSRVVSADSGWDYDYDSGSSWDSDSSWDSSSSWSSDGSGIYIGGDLSDTDPEIIIAVLVILAIIIILSLRKAKQIDVSKVPLQKGTIKEELSYDEIKAIDPNLDKELLKEQVFNLYKDVQIAWMNFDYDTLRKNLTDEMYNMYSSQLKTLKLKNQKNIMKDITLTSCKITSIDIANGKEEVQIYLNVIQYDYVIDKDKKVVRGTDKYKNNVEYKITLVRNIDNKKIEKCPNCNAPIEIVSGGVCPYCDSTIINNNEEFIMSKKECISQSQKHPLTISTI